MPAATKTTTITKTAGPTKPTYSVMVTETLKSLGNRNANSLYVISKELAQKYNVDINKHALSKAIKKGVESGDLIQVKASYKLNKTAAPAKKPAKTATKTKKALPASKPVKKSAAKTSVKKSMKSTTSKVTKKAVSPTAPIALKPKKTLKKSVKSAKTAPKRAKVVQTMTKVTKTVSSASKKASPAK